jgi:MFS transporter, DHA1 family, multidrug resistance protein
MPLSVDMYVPGLPRLTHDLHASASEVQLTLTGFMAGAALGQLLSGPLSDAVGRRRPLLVGTACYSAASLLCAFAPDVHIFTGLRVAQGVAGAAGAVISRAIVRDLHAGAAAARYFSRLMLVNGAAPVLAPVIGGQLLRFTSWRTIFVVLAGMGVVMFAAVAVGLGETLPPERRHGGGLGASARTIRRLIGDRPFAAYTLTQAAAAGAMFAYIGGSSFALQGIYGVSPATYGLLFGINALGLVTLSQVNAHLVRTIEPRRLLSLGCALGLAGGILLVVTVLGDAGLGAALAAFFLVVSSLGFSVPNATALALSDHPEAAGTGAALMGVAAMLVGAIVVPLGGIAGRDTAVPLSILILVLEVMAFLALPVALRFRPARRPEPADVVELAHVDA